MIPSEVTTSTLLASGGVTPSAGSAWWAFGGCVVILVVADLLLARKSKQASIRRSSLELLFLFLVVITFAVFVMVATEMGGSGAFQFLSAYFSEWLMSLDNLFVMKLLIDSFDVPEAHRQKVLSVGIWGAILLRCAFIWSGTTALQHLTFVASLMGLLLILTARSTLKENHEDRPISESRMYRLAAKVLPLTPEPRGGKLLVHRRKSLLITPLGFCAVLLVLSGLVFALDSIPVVLSITTNLFIAVSSNVLSVMGQRSVYALFEPLKKRIPNLSKAMALILGFIGTCLILGDSQSIGWIKTGVGWLLGLVHAHVSTGWLHAVHIPTVFEIAVIGLILAVTAIIDNVPKRKRVSRAADK